jgi:excisionase family DNA binding protein
MCGDQDLLTTSDVARELDISESWIRRLTNLGRLPALRTSNGTRIFSGRDVNAFRVARDRQLTADSEAS